MSIKKINVGETLPLNTISEIDDEIITINQSHTTNFPFDIDLRFRYQQRLGRGGDGLIYKAFDQTLQRYVALKFLLNPNADNRLKLVAEARAQANVEHAYICPIYEVVESDKGIYLVMKFIEGENLQDIAPSLSIEQLLVLNQKVAEGLHVAHTQGLIHRDFKPANVMVNMASNILEPLIVDFGLAQQDESLAETNNKNIKAVGTKGFIAPEVIAEPDVKMHRRVDIFSFGVSLLYCFTGKLIQHEDDKSLHQYLLTTDLPKDIQIIIAKCMAYKPVNRYQSANDISQEITRYLNGEPIKARSDKGYWLRQKLKKHLWLTLAISTTILGVSGMYLSQVYQTHQQSIREVALLEFNSQLKELEYQVQLTYMAPRHNIEENIEQWRSTVKQLENDISSISSNLLAATHYAVGRIYNVLDEHQLAVKHLQIAMDLENHNDEGAFYLAISLGALYNEEIKTVRNLTDESLRNARLIDITHRLKDPAINLLSEHLSSAPHQTYAKALLAYYQQDWSSAIKLLDDSTDLPSWYYQDDILRGDILLEQAREITESGKSNALVNQLLEQSLQQYLIAAEIAPSDPNVVAKPLYVKAAHLLLLNEWGQAAPIDFMDNISIYENSIKKIDNSFPISNQLIGQITHLYGLNLQYNNGKPEQWFKIAEAKLLQAKNLSDTNHLLWLFLGQHYTDVAKFKMASGADPARTLEKAVAALKHISAQYRDYSYFNELGTLNRYLALEAENNNQSSESYFQSAIDNYVKANNHSPNKIGSLINAASTLRKKSESSPFSVQIKELLAAKLLLEKVIKLEPNHFVANYYLAFTLIELVRLNLYQEINDVSYFDLAVRQMEKVKSINGTHPYILDLELKLKRLELENTFSKQQKWIEEFDQLINDQFKLMTKFYNNTLVIQNYIGTLTSVIGYRIQLGLSVDDYILKLQKAIDAHPNIENVQAYQALSELFIHWEDPDFKALNLIKKYRLRDKQSFIHKWALYMMLIANGANQSELNEGIKLIKEDRNLLPFYRDMLLAWVNGN